MDESGGISARHHGCIKIARQFGCLAKKSNFLGSHQKYRGSLLFLLKIDVNHSFLNIILPYNEWIIKVQYADEPNAIYSHTIKVGKIVETGVLGDVDKEDLKHKY